MRGYADLIKGPEGVLLQKGMRKGLKKEGWRDQKNEEERWGKEEGLAVRMRVGAD